MKCPICGGATMCPGALQVIPAETVWIKNVAPFVPPAVEGATLTHTCKRVSLFVKHPPPGYKLMVVGSKMATRIEYHTGVKGVWVDMCKYAFYKEEKKGESHGD